MFKRTAVPPVGPSKLQARQPLNMALDLVRVTFAICLVAVLLTACSKAEECRLCGKWKSDEARTLAEMEKVATLTEAQLKLFKSDFFGRLIVETEPTVERSYFQEDGPDGASWEPWKIISENGDKFQIESRGLEDGTVKVTTVRFEGNCYIIEMPDLGFGEWLCRI